MPFTVTEIACFTGGLHGGGNVVPYFATLAAVLLALSAAGNAIAGSSPVGKDFEENLPVDG
jgi:hypothetical protein